MSVELTLCGGPLDGEVIEGFDHDGCGWVQIHGPSWGLAEGYYWYDRTGPDKCDYIGMRETFNETP